jgi:hypothetical protein
MPFTPSMMMMMMVMMVMMGDLWATDQSQSVTRSGISGEDKPH